MDSQVTRRRLIATGCTVAASVASAGCMDASDDGTTDPGDSSPDDSNKDPHPQVKFEFDYATGETLDADGSPWDGADSDGTLTITHHGGDTVEASTLFVRGSSITTDGDGVWADQANGGGMDGKVVSGSAIAIEADTDSAVRIVWESSESDNSATLGEWSGPEA